MSKVFPQQRPVIVPGVALTQIFRFERDSYTAYATHVALTKRCFVVTRRVALKKSGTRIPRVELEEMGPNFDFIVRRTHLASDDLFKKACRKPKAAKVSHNLGVCSYNSINV